MTAEEIARFFNESDLFKSLGFRITELNQNSLVLEISDNNPCHRGGFGLLKETGINGAVISAAMESALGICGFNALGGKPAGVIELSVKILRVIRKKPCRIKATVDRKSKNLAFVSATLYSARGGICANATGIVVQIGDPKSIANDSDS